MEKLIIKRKKYRDERQIKLSTPRDTPRATAQFCNSHYESMQKLEIDKKLKKKTLYLGGGAM